MKLTKDDELLEKYNNIWDKVSNSIKKNLIGNQYAIKKNLKTKIKSYKGKISTNFRDNRIPKENFNCIFLSLILIDFVFKIGKIYDPQVLLEEYKKIVKETKRN